MCTSPVVSHHYYTHYPFAPLPSLPPPSLCPPGFPLVLAAMSLAYNVCTKTPLLLVPPSPPTTSPLPVLFSLDVHPVLAAWPTTFAQRRYFYPNNLLYPSPPHIHYLCPPGVPPVLAAMSLAYNVNLFGSITHYASGQAAVYCGSGFVRINEVFKFGALNGAMSLIICE